MLQLTNTVKSGCCRSPDSRFEFPQKNIKYDSLRPFALAAYESIYLEDVWPKVFP